MQLQQQQQEYLEQITKIFIRNYNHFKAKDNEIRHLARLLTIHRLDCSLLNKVKKNLTKS